MQDVNSVPSLTGSSVQGQGSFHQRREPLDPQERLCRAVDEHGTLVGVPDDSPAGDLLSLLYTASVARLCGLQRKVVADVLLL